jgi:hypothetical protein
MTWERRLREMVLAGGALAATACSDNAATSVDAADVFAECCNANSDPCCPMAYCTPGGGPDASSYVLCEQGRTTCEAQGGSYTDLADGSQGCSYPPEAGPGDHFDAFSECCNVNPDPCCPIAYCTPGGGPDASSYVLCEQGRTTCEAQDGAYEYQPDGSIGCSYPPGAGPGDGGDAHEDAAPGDASDSGDGHD